MTPTTAASPLSPAERAHAADLADRVRAALPRYLLLAHKAQREAARLQYLYVQPKADVFPQHDIRYIASPSPFAGEDEAWDDMPEDALDDPYPFAAVSTPAPARTEDVDAPGDGPDDEVDDDDADDDLPDDDTDIGGPARPV